MENKRCKKSRQWFKKVLIGNDAKFYIKQDKSIKMTNARRIETYSNDVYVSNKVKIKPHALHTIVSHTKAALKTYHVKPKQIPTIVILSESELPTAYGRYDAIQNLVYYIPEIADKKIMRKDFGLIEYHEMWHLKQANDFREKGWEIAEENYQQYVSELCKACKKKKTHWV